VALTAASQQYQEHCLPPLPHSSETINSQTADIRSISRACHRAHDDAAGQPRALSWKLRRGWELEELMSRSSCRAIIGCETFIMRGSLQVSTLKLDARPVHTVSPYHQPPLLPIEAVGVNITNHSLNHILGRKVQETKDHPIRLEAPWTFPASLHRGTRRTSSGWPSTWLGTSNQLQHPEE